MGVHSLSSYMLYLSLLVLSVAAVSVSAADADLVLKMCQNSKSSEFCYDTLITDPRTAAADINGLSVISVSLTIITVQETTDKITEFLKHENDSVVKEHLTSCQGNYAGSYSKFQQAWNSALEKSYNDVLNLVKDGRSEGSTCENGFRSEPIRISPLTDRTDLLLQHVEIIVEIISPH
ncbi:pectinesterase inhibitor 5-like, partial [Papaver somniferum]|uniref:pectinesterase inhibitor 5-like n=1 Tax=Papaver somniferum TaxID=3469 RepID=UPI000E6F9329